MKANMSQSNLIIRKEDMEISIYGNAPSPVRHAADRLAKYTGLFVGKGEKGKPCIRIELNKGNNSRIGKQGYTIRSSDDLTILIQGNNDEGVANGISTFLRTLMIKNLKNPFDQTWNIEEKPHFYIRGMIVAPYRFGGSYGYAVLSPDRWSVNEWIEYIDLMRLCNINRLTLVPAGRTYHPDYYQTHREKWRYEVWRDVIKYCHQVGISCTWLTCPNLVPQEVYWNNPNLRAIGQETGGYFACGLNWRKAKDLILDINRYTFEYLNELDGLEMIYSETGFSFDEETSADPAGYFADATNAYRKMLNETGGGKEYVFWNWVFDLWSKVVLPEQLLNKFPKFRTILDDLIPMLPKDISWLDASMLSVIQMFGQEIRARGNPPLREGVLLGKEKGFSPVINCFWYMNPEYAINMLPHPYIRRGIQEARYTQDEIHADGVTGYRLAPPCKFLDDYTYFRLASDPLLSQEQLIEEMAGILCKKGENKKTAIKAINMLEEFWTTHDLKTIENSDNLFNSTSTGETSKILQNVSNAVTFLHYIVKISQPEVSEKQRSDLKRELYERLKTMYVFQGITSDVIWQPESYAIFYSKVDLMVQQYLWYKSSIPDFVDRKIYPEATSSFVTLNWPKLHSEPGLRDEEIGKMPGPFTFD